MKPVFAYWDFRGFGEVIRCLLHYTGTDFEDKRYEGDEWDREKNTLGLDFPNLPYFIDDEVKMTQSFAIIWHIARKHGLTPKVDEQDLWRVQMVELQVVDFIMGFIHFCYGHKSEKEKEDYIKSIGERLTPFSKFMGDNPWLLGDHLTYVDFIFHEELERHRYLDKTFLDPFPNLKNFFERFEALPGVEKYHKSDKYKRWPIHDVTAKFGGSRDPMPF